MECEPLITSIRIVRTFNTILTAFGEHLIIKNVFFFQCEFLSDEKYWKEESIKAIRNLKTDFIKKEFHGL